MNSQQITTDIYNMLVHPQVAPLYPELFKKTSAKREERMSSFTTSTGVKILAGTVGTEQRGALQEDARPDFILFEDFENRKTLRSAVTTQAIWDNMEEARTSLSKDGSAVYSCNYISEAGNVHKLVEKYQNNDNAEVLIVPIITDEGVITWPERFTQGDIDQMRQDDDDFEGERLCKPSASADVFFHRPALEKMPVLEPIKEINSLKIFKRWDARMRYASGHDVAGGVGLDSSTSVFMNLDADPIEVVATYKDNRIKPDTFADEIKRQREHFAEPLCAIERNNHGHTTIARARQLGIRLYSAKPKDTKIKHSTPTEYGWHTNTNTKPKMLYDLAKAIEKGLIHLNDPDLIAEAKSYTRNDLMDDIKDPRLATRHFDLLIACFIKGTRILTDEGQRPIETLKVGDKVMTRDGYKRITATHSSVKNVTTNIGLTGTPDHPVICKEGVKDLSEVSSRDIIYVWNSKKQAIENMSFTEAQGIIATQMQNKETTGCTLWEGRNGRNREHTCIEKFGLTTMEKFKKVIAYTTKTVTQTIMPLRTLKRYLRVSICDSIWKNRREESWLRKFLIIKKIEKSKKQVIEKLLKIKYLKRLTAVYVGRILNQLLITPSFAHATARGRMQIEEDETLNKNEYVSFADKDFKQVIYIKRSVPKNVPRSTTPLKRETERVYNLEVEDTPEYFANGILVHNCAIAYQMRYHAGHKIKEMSTSEYESVLKQY